MKRKFFALLLALTLVLGLAACGSKDEEMEEAGAAEGTEVVEATEEEKEEGMEEEVSSEGKFIRTNNSSEPGTLDPALAQGTHESWILGHIFEGLMKYDSEGKLVNGMAENMEVSEDGLTYTFTLKDGVKWSNGDPVTAEDFEFSWKRVLDPEMASDYAYQLFYIKNAEAYNASELDVEEVGITALDEKTLEVVLENPIPYFPDLTAFYTYFPVNKAVAEADPKWANNAETHVSNGAFMLDKWEHDSQIVILKNDNYYDSDLVKIAGVEFDIIAEQSTAYEKYAAGEYDMLVDAPQAVVAKMLEEKNPELIIGKMAGTYYYNFNSENPVFSNSKIRKAFSLSLDRNIIVEKIAQGGQIPAYGVVPFGLPDPDGKEFRDYNGELFAEDNEMAKKLLEEGLKEEGLTLDDLQGLVLLYNTSEGHQKIAEVAQEMWKQNLGVEVGLENVDFQVKLDREKAGDYDISRAGWIGDFADPMTMLELWHEDSAFNDARYKNPEYTAIIDEVKASNDQKFRFEKMAEAERMVMEDMPVAPIYYYTQPYLVHENVKGIYKALLNYPTLTYAEID